MNDQIYYLLDFHKKCIRIITYDETIIDKYCIYVNLQLNRFFTKEEQEQLKMSNFER